MPTELSLQIAIEIVGPPVTRFMERERYNEITKIASIIDWHLAELTAERDAALAEVERLESESVRLHSALDSALFRAGHVEEIERGQMVADVRAVPQPIEIPTDRPAAFETHEGPG